MREQEGRQSVVTSLSVGDSQSERRDGGISDVAVELQKLGIFLPGCFHHWHCKQEKVETDISEHHQHTSNVIQNKKIQTVYLTQYINTGAVVGLITNTTLAALLALVYSLPSFERVLDKRLIFLLHKQHYNVLDNFRIHNNF